MASINKNANSHRLYLKITEIKMKTEIKNKLKK